MAYVNEAGLKEALVKTKDYIQSWTSSSINALDVAENSGGAAKTLLKISETDGKISTEFGNIAIAASQVTSGTLDAARIPSLNASKINAGTLDAARIPTLDQSKVSGLSDALSGKQNASTAVTHTASTKVGDANKPVYVAANGAATACTYELNKSVPSNAVFTDHVTTATDSGTGNVVTGVSADANGNLTVTKGTVSATDTKNTAGATNTNSKIFIVGATSQGDNPQTYTHTNAYVGTDHCLYSNGSKVLTAHQSLANYYTKGQVDSLVSGSLKYGGLLSDSATYNTTAKTYSNFNPNKVGEYFFVDKEGQMASVVEQGTLVSNATLEVGDMVVVRVLDEPAAGDYVVDVVQSNITSLTIAEVDQICAQAFS